MATLTKSKSLSARTFVFSLLSFGILGIMFGFWQVLLADLQRSLGLSAGALGGALTLGFAASLPAMLLGGRIADRFGASALIVMAGSGMSLGLLLVAATGSYWLLVLALLIFLGAAGSYDVAVNAAAIGLEQRSKRKLMGYLHAGYSGFAALGALLAGTFLFAGVPFRALYVLVALVIVVFVVTLWLTRALADGAAVADLTQAVKRPGLYRSGPLLLVALIVALAFLSEGTLENWSAIYLRSSLELPAVLGASGVAVFHSAMLLGRLSAAQAVRRFRRRSILRSAGVMAAVGMALALATELLPLILLGFLVVGLSLAAVAPIGFSLAGDLAPGRAGEASSIITFVGYSGFLFGPVMIGALAEAAGLRLALATVILAGVLMALVSMRLAKSG